MTHLACLDSRLAGGNDSCLCPLLPLGGRTSKSNDMQKTLDVCSMQICANERCYEMFTASDVIYYEPYSIFDPAFCAETSRLTSQHAALRTCLSLFPPELLDKPSPRVLNLACGAGHWLLDTAYELKDSMVVGIDPNQQNIEYAHTQARLGCRQNISCEVMDLRRPLPLPSCSFDLIIGCFLSAWLTEREGLPFLVQCKRFLRPGGTLRLIEATAGHSSSRACEQLSSWYEQALLQTGVRPLPASLCLDWSDLLRQAGYQHTNKQKILLDFSAESVAHRSMRTVVLAFSWLVRSFILKSGIVTEETFQQTYDLIALEMNREDFSGSWHLLDLQGLCPTHDFCPEYRAQVIEKRSTGRRKKRSNCLPLEA